MGAKGWPGCAGAEGHGQGRTGKGIAVIPGACRADNQERRRNITGGLKCGSPGFQEQGHGKKTDFSPLLEMPLSAQPGLQHPPHLQSLL